MRLPRELCNESVSVEDYLGAGAFGPTFSAVRAINVNRQNSYRLMLTDVHGKSVTIDTTLLVRPEDGPIRPESRIAIDGNRYRVVAYDNYYETPRSVAFYEVHCALWDSDSSEPAPGGSGSGSPNEIV